MATYIFRSNCLFNAYLTTHFSFENKSKLVILFFNLLEIEKTSNLLLKFTSARTPLYYRSHLHDVRTKN